MGDRLKVIGYRLLVMVFLLSPLTSHLLPLTFASRGDDRCG